MRKFRRIVTRAGFENVPEWKEGYEFESNDYNGYRELGYCYALDDKGNRHDWDTIVPVGVSV